MRLQQEVTALLRGAVMTHIEDQGLDTPKALEKASKLSLGRCRMLLQNKEWETRDAFALIERLNVPVDIKITVRMPPTPELIIMDINRGSQEHVPARMDDVITIDVPSASRPYFAGQEAGLSDPWAD